MKKFTLLLKVGFFLALIVFLTAFSNLNTYDECIENLQKAFSLHYDLSQESDQIKRYELNVTNNGFCRYKRYFINGKTEYFAFNLSKFKDLDYYGANSTGKLYLYTKGDDVIVQTHNDKNGDVDSMATQVVIPLKNIEPEDLIQIRANLSKVSVKL